MAEVAALLLNWQQPALTVQCLRDLLAAVPSGLRVAVIDNGSRDDSVAVLRAEVASHVGRGAAVELIALPENRGFTGGMNAGFEWAQHQGADHALVLNNDLRLEPGFLEPLVATLQNDARVAAVTPTVVHPDGTVWAQGGDLGFCPNGLRLRAHGERPAPIDQGPELVDFAPGACVLFRLSAVMEAGAFDDRYFMYWEDVDLSRRLAQRGGRIVWLPWVRVTHLGGASAGGGRSQLRKYLMAKNGVRFLRQRGSLRQWLAWLLLDVCSLPALLCLRPAAGRAKASGLVAGLLGRPSGERDVARWRVPVG